YIPVFFFLVVVFGCDNYPGPYRHVDKGLLILYHLLSGCSIAEMGSPTDCVGLDGGYTLFITSILASNEHLAKHNFVHPIRRTRNGDLSSDESKYNEVFGSFRSKIEAVFGELGHLCNRFDGKSVIKVGDMDGFELQLKLACLLLNMKRFVSLGQVSPQPHHTSWVQQDFDFP
ncbi:hypothetical protein K492DRAFT_111394, partial [Lichtheimia hyalospora FSU 10163]